MDEKRIEAKLEEISGRIDTLAAIQQEMATSFAVFYKVHEKQEVEFKDQQDKVRANCRAVSELQLKNSNIELRLDQRKTVCNEGRVKVDKLLDEFVLFKTNTNKSIKKLEISTAVLTVKIIGGGLIGGFLATALLKVIFK